MTETDAIVAEPEPPMCGLCRSGMVMMTGGRRLICPRCGMERAID